MTHLDVVSSRLFSGLVTIAEIKEYKALKSELFGDDMFAVLDDDCPKVMRYNELMRKLFF